MRTRLADKEREQWIDVVKGVAILCVILGHAIEKTSVNVNVSVFWNVLHDVIYSFHMPLFFAISGYVYAINGQKKKNSVFIKNKILSLLVPYVIFAILVWCGKYIFSAFVSNQVTFGDLLELFMNPISFLWFIYILFFATVITKLLDSLIQNNCIVFLICVAMIIIRLIIQTNVILIHGILLYTGFYYSGVIFYQYKEQLTKKWVMLLVTIAYCATVILSFQNQLSFVFITIMNAMGTLFFLSLFYIVLGKRKLPSNHIIMTLGKLTMYLYMIHPIMISGVGSVLNYFKVPYALVWIFILVSVGIVIPYLYAQIAKRIKILDYPFCPQKYIK